VLKGVRKLKLLLGPFEVLKKDVVRGIQIIELLKKEGRG
jgi:hypothetical protein